MPFVDALKLWLAKEIVGLLVFGGILCVIGLVMLVLILTDTNWWKRWKRWRRT